MSIAAAHLGTLRMNLTGKILALDLATSTGWACGLPDEMPAFGTYVFTSTGDRFGRHQKNARIWISAKLEIEQPHYVIYEQPSLFGKTTPSTMRKLASFANTLEEECDERRIRCEQANPSTVKLFWTGKGHADKPTMIAWAKRFGFRVRNDDEADALAHWFYAIECHGSTEQKARFQQMKFEAGMGTKQRERF